ncbi:MAG TPA: undecaprenyl-diphosphate phosphatase [Candidatus Cottocaccamicrobium excrementipullorum]|nr:undecaprenyl-diphosphate phosphatase [Candidatus Cottocaccamicrobium excrementipullorum]
MSLVEILKVIVQGIVEGFTEWLPISSTGHMILVDEIIHMDQPKAYLDVFFVVIQLGAILAVVLLYFDRLNPFSRRKKKAAREATLVLWLKIIVACIPAAVLGLLFNDWMEEHLMNAYVVAAALIIYGVIFIVLENRNRNARFPIQKTGQITFQVAFYIGLFQLLSLIPGTSRSGSTILGAMILGCSRGAAAEFSFFLGIPVMLGASLLKIVSYFMDGNGFTGPQVFYLILGMVVAFFMSVYSIKFLMGYIRNHDFKFFGYYRIVLGIVVLAYFGITALAV